MTVKKCNYCGYKTNNLAEVYCPEGDLLIQPHSMICSCGSKEFSFEHMHEETEIEEIIATCVVCGKEWRGGK